MIPDPPGGWWQSWQDRANLTWGVVQFIFGGWLVGLASSIEAFSGTVANIA